MSLHRRGGTTKPAPELQTLSIKGHYVTSVVELCARGSPLRIRSHSMSPGTSKLARAFGPDDGDRAERSDETGRDYSAAALPSGTTAETVAPSLHPDSKGANLQVLEKDGGDDGTRTRGLCRDSALV